MTQPKFKHPDLIPARKVAFTPDPRLYPNRWPEKQRSGAQSFTRAVERDQLEEWIAQLEARCETHPDLILKGSIPQKPWNTRDGKPKPRVWKYVGPVRDIPQDPTVCVVRISKTTGVVCFFSETADELEPLSEELPLSEACKLAKQLEDES